MSDNFMDKVKEGALKHGLLAGMGAAVGAATHHAIKPKLGMPTPMTAQIASAMGAAASNGAGVGGTVAAGTAIVVAKAAAITAVASAAAPFVLGAAVVGGTIWGTFKVLEYFDE